MNNGPLLFLGILLTVVTSFCGLILAPHLQLGRQQPVVLETGETYPQPRPGLARQGAQVYRALGCAECHSIQVRGVSGDLQRGLARRISVAADYLHDYPVELGRLRLGPDLANYGSANTNEARVLLHLYEPHRTMPGSLMPPARYLFEKRTLLPGDKIPDDAILVSTNEGPRLAVVPLADAKALAAYLMSLQCDVALPEAPVPAPPKKAASAAAATNAAAPVSSPAK